MYLMLLFQIELMCLLTHGKMLNDICNDDLLKGFAMSLYGKTNLKGKQCNVANIQKVIKTVRQRIVVENDQKTDVHYLDTVTIVSAYMYIIGLKTGGMSGFHLQKFDSVCGLHHLFRSLSILYVSSRKILDIAWLNQGF